MPKFKHYTDALGTIKSLKKSGKDSELERILWWCVESTEAESTAEGLGVAPYYYEELAKLYRKRKDYQAEAGILERFAQQIHAPGVKPAKLLERLERARELVSKIQQ
jgi:hypothetical protein